MQTRFQRTALAAVIGAGACFVAPASFALMFDQDVTPDVIFGSGNANGGFTVDQSNGIELGLRGKLRFNDANSPENTFNSNGDGTYSFDAGLPPTGFGFAPGSTSTAVWNFEWSINSDYAGTAGRNLNALTYLLEIDFDPTGATNFLAFDLINVAFADHSIGNNGTASNGGAEAADAAGYAALIDGNNVAQNSWNMEFFDNAGAGFPFDGRTQGIYDIRLSALDGSTQLASVSIQVETVPEPATLALASTALLGFAIRRRRRG